MRNQLLVFVVVLYSGISGNGGIGIRSRPSNLGMMSPLTKSDQGGMMPLMGTSPVTSSTNTMKAYYQIMVCIVGLGSKTSLNYTDELTSRSMPKVCPG